MQMTTHLLQKAKTKEPLNENERGELKLNIQKTKLMSSGPITSWQIDGETIETVTDFIFGAPKLLQMVTAAMQLKDTCSLEEKLWPTKKVHLGKAMVLPVVMYRCENWSTKKAKHWRIDAFELWCWRILLKVPWTARRFNQSILKEKTLSIH